MSKNRLAFLLVALSLTVLALLGAPPAAQADLDCSQFNGSGCFYLLDPRTGCCVPTRIWCIWYCPE